MNISDMAAYADMLAALGVIASLLFLALQVRSYNRTARHQHYESILGRLADVFARPLDERVAEIFDKGKRSFDDLGASERTIFDAWANEYVMSVSNIYRLAHQGIVDPAVAAMVDRRIKWFFKYPGTTQWWRDADRHPHPADFEAMFDKALSTAKSTTV